MMILTKENVEIKKGKLLGFNYEPVSGEHPAYRSGLVHDVFKSSKTGNTIVQMNSGSELETFKNFNFDKIRDIHELTFSV